MTERIALIDGDIFCYESAAAAEEPIHWGDGLWTLHAWEEPAKQQFVERVNEVAELVEADRIIFALTDGENWRKSVLPSYKANRANVRKPMLLPLLRDYAREHFEVFLRPSLEGDDILGILSTWSGLPGDKVIVSIDKDFRTIPGKVFYVNRPDDGILTVSEEEADLFHMMQTLAGDTTDGYAGCPGVGMQTAQELLTEMLGWEPYDHTFKTGKRAGETEQRWQKVPMQTLWDVVVSCYRKAGLGEEEALRQARVARICRATDYDFKNRKVKLWSPR